MFFKFYVARLGAISAADAVPPLTHEKGVTPSAQTTYRNSHLDSRNRGDKRDSIQLKAKDSSSFAHWSLFSN